MVENLNLIQNSDNSIANDQEVDAVGRRKKESSNSISLVASNINLAFPNLEQLSSKLSKDFPRLVCKLLFLSHPISIDFQLKFQRI